MDLVFSRWEWLSLNLNAYPWLLEVFVVILGTLVCSYTASFLFARLAKRLERTVNLWDDALLNAARKPAFCLIWLMGFSWVVEILVAKSDAAIFSSLVAVRQLFVIALLVWFLIRLIRQVESRLVSDEYTSDPMDPTTVSALGKLIRLTIILTALLVVMQTLGYSISGVLAFGGVGGIAVGFAAKDLLSNFFGGLMIYLDRPFAVGDWVRSPDQEIEGTVEHIGWRQTRIRTFDKRPLYVPNSTFTHISVENPSRMSNRRIYETIGVRYDDADKVADIVAAVKAMLQQHPDIDQQQTLIVNFNAFAASSLDFFVYTFTKTVNWIEYHEVKQRVLLQILAIIDEHGADIAFPTSTIKLADPIEMIEGDKA
jgi:MscS family membrane protein